jgi:hypothetical protein
MAPRDPRRIVNRASADSRIGSVFRWSYFTQAQARIFTWAARSHGVAVERLVPLTSEHLRRPADDAGEHAVAEPAIARRYLQSLLSTGEGEPPAHAMPSLLPWRFGF